MAVNKVVLGERTIIDLSGDTVSKEHVTKGITFHRPDGEIDTGELEPSSGGDATTVQTYRVQVLDYDGSVIKEEWHVDGDVFVLPDAPTHEGLMFKKWICPLTITDNTVIVPDIELYIKAYYEPEDGKSRFYITLKDADSQLTNKLRLAMPSGAGNVAVTVDWGDGFEETYTFIGNGSYHEYIHTYEPESFPVSYVVTVHSEKAGLVIQSGNLIQPINTAAYNTILDGVHLVDATIRDDTWYRAVHSKFAHIDGLGTGTRAFGYNYTLDNVTVAERNSIPSQTFQMCRSLEKVALNNEIFSIQSAAFNGCIKLSSIVLPEKLTTLSSSVFDDCRALARIKIPNTLETIGQKAFNNCGIDNIDLPEGLTTIGNYAFYGCSRLQHIEIPSTVTSIGANAFQACWGLKSVSLPSSFTSAPAQVFSGCSSLRKLNLQANLTSIAGQAFQSCYSLEEAPLHDGLTTIGTYAFEGCASLTSIVIPDSVTSIGTYAFRNCTGLHKVVLSSAIPSIANYTFYGCYVLTSIVIPDSVTSIGTSAFQSCTNLKKVTFGSGVSTIAANAFNNGAALELVDFRKSTAVPTLSASSAFGNTPATVQIVVPDELYDEWIAATNWTSLASKIYKASEVTIE